MRRRAERRIEAYHDGGLSRSGRERVERLLRRDLAGGRHLQKTAALGEMIREAWTEGPSAPMPEHLIGALRPAMARVDAERAAATLSRVFGTKYGFAPFVRRVHSTCIAQSGKTSPKSLIGAFARELRPPGLAYQHNFPQIGSPE